MTVLSPYSCVRCGYRLDEHKPNLVNEPAQDFPWLDEPAEGYSMDILTCMETGHPEEYAALLTMHEEDLLGWPGIETDGLGYVSPDPLQEGSDYLSEGSEVATEVWLITASGQIVDIGS